MLNKLRDKEKLEKMKNRYNRYKNPISYDKDKIPDFELQLPSDFNIKYKRSDALGVRNLIVNENELLRAHRPNMDKLIVLSKLRHEVKGSKHFDTPTSLNDGDVNLQFEKHENIQNQFPKIISEKDNEFKLDSKFESVSMDRVSKISLKISEAVGKNYKGKQDFGNVFNGIRKNFYPTYGVTYIEQKKQNNIDVPSSYHSGYKLLNSSTKKLLNSNSNSIDVNMKMKGKEYASSLEGVHMKRREYELRNISIDNMRPFYSKNNSQASFESIPQKASVSENSETDNEMDMLKK